MLNFQGYELTKELGRGATARVFLARELATSEWVSLKVFHPGIFQDPELRQRIHREMALSMLLEHKNIVRMRKILHENDPPALTMDYIDGENLEKFQARLPYVLPEVSVLVVIQILEALEYAHSRGLIHRDLKPENVLIEKSGRAYLTDFGLAKFAGSTLITQANMVVGSIEYMSPEQAKGDALSPSSDLFSVASLLYFLVTGTRPFSRANPVATLRAIQEEEPEPPQNRNPKISAGLVRILNRGMEKKPGDRFSGAGEFKAVLNGYLDGLKLNSPDFTLALWSQRPSATAIDALQTSAARLIERCEMALKEKDWDEFLELMSHLSVKAPESPSIPRLLSDYRSVVSKRKWLHRSAAAAVLLTCLTTGAVLRWAKGRSHHSHVNPTSLNDVEISVPSQPMGAIVASPEADEALANGEPTFASAVPRHSPPKKLHQVYVKSETRPASEKAKPPLSSGTGEVYFNVGDDVKVFWDGRLVDANQPLFSEKTGSHFLLLERPNREPLRAQVHVKEEEPTVINAMD